MPMPTDSLTKESSDEEIRRAISATISMLVDEGRPQDQAMAIAMDSARRNAGRVPGAGEGQGTSKLKMQARG